MGEVVFAKGFSFKRASEDAPAFIIGKVSISVNDAVEFLREHEDNGWVTIELKKSKGGKFYFDLDTWKPNKESAGASSTDEFKDDIPF